MSADIHEIKEECLQRMKEVCTEHKEKYERAGGDPNEFEMLILEQWRPW